MKSLKDLFMDTNSAKQSIHRFGFIYDLIFSKVFHRKGSPIRVLELGVSEYGDGSLRAYATSEMVDEAVGVDINQYTGELLENMRFYLKDAYLEETLEMLDEKEEHFDIIIDDGSSDYEDHLFFLERYIDLLNPGGFLICDNVKNLKLIADQCKREDVFFFDGWGNLEWNILTPGDPKMWQHLERLLIKAKSEKLTDYPIRENKPHIARLPIEKFRTYERTSTELAISVPLYHPDYDAYDVERFQEIHCKGAVWAAMSMIHNTDLGDHGVPIFFHIEDKVWNDALPVFKEFGVPITWCRKMSLPEPTVELTLKKPQYGKSFMALIDEDIDADVTMILDSDLFTCVTDEKLRLYKKLTTPILKRQPAMTYFRRNDMVYWWWVSVLQTSAPLSAEAIEGKPLNIVEQMAYETLGFEKELEDCKSDEGVNRYYADEYIKTFPREHAARDFAIQLLPQCYTPCYAFSVWSEFNHPLVELDGLLGVPTYDWEYDFRDAKRGENCFAHIRVQRGLNEKLPQPSIINQYWDRFLGDISRYVVDEE